MIKQFIIKHYIGIFVTLFIVLVISFLFILSKVMVYDNNKEYKVICNNGSPEIFSNKQEFENSLIVCGMFKVEYPIPSYLDTINISEASKTK